jgi:hypothetical protein
MLRSEVLLESEHRNIGDSQPRFEVRDMSSLECAYHSFVGLALLD